MKKKIMITGACLLVIVGAIISILTAGKKPFKDLTQADIVSATVRRGPPDKTVQIEDTEELVKLLKDVVVYNKDNSYTEYSGDGCIFTLSLPDGSQKEITDFYPFLVIDRTGYKTRYEPCEALNRYANKLFNGK